MGILDNFERGLERAVNGAFAKTFRSGLQPVELTSAIRKEMDTKAAVVARDRVLAPNRFVLRMSTADYKRIRSPRAALTDELRSLPHKHATRQHYAKLYARPGAMHAAFAQFRSIRQDAVDNQSALARKLPMPVLAIGGAKSFGEMEAVVMRNAASNVTGVVIPDSGHWLMEEAPKPTISAVRDFLAR